MKRLGKKFKEVLKRHKRMLHKMCLDKDERLIPYVQKTAKQLALVYANYCCEKCKRKNELQYHHLVQRHVKEFTDIWRYRAQRDYWGNLLILCKKCHGEIEGREILKNMPVISSSHVKELKESMEEEDVVN